MELIVPFMLFILGISEDEPAQIELSRHPVLYETEEECLEAGRKVVQARTAGGDDSTVRFEIYCKQVPLPDEYEQFFSRRDFTREDNLAEPVK